MTICSQTELILIILSEIFMILTTDKLRNSVHFSISVRFNRAESEFYILFNLFNMIFLRKN